MAGSLLSFLPARAGQASETVPVLNSVKARTWRITNYVNNNSNENQFTPYKPQERKKEERGELINLENLEDELNTEGKK